MGPPGSKEFAYSSTNLVHSYYTATIFSPVKPRLPEFLPAVVVNACQELYSSGATNASCCNMEPIRHESTDVPDKFEAITMKVVNGFKENGDFVGKLTSQIQRLIDEDMGCPLRTGLDLKNATENPNSCEGKTSYYSAHKWKGNDFSLFNEKNLRYLHLEGDYIADVPLRLPSLMVLQLNGSITAGPSLPEGIKNMRLSEYSISGAHNQGMVLVDTEKFVGIVGGFYNGSIFEDLTEARYTHYDQKRVVGVVAIKFFQSSYCLLTETKATVGKYSESVVLLSQATYSMEVSHNEFFGTHYSDYTNFPANNPDYYARCFWSLYMRYVLVHDNYIHHCTKHSLDFDSGTQNSMAYNNLGVDLKTNYIFVEEESHDNFIFNNTGRNTQTAVVTYSLWEGPCVDNKFINNVGSNNQIGYMDGGGGSVQNCDTFAGQLFT